MTIPLIDPRTGIEIRYATPGDADAIAALYDKVYGGGYPIAEVTDPMLVRRIVTNQEHIWVLALDGETVVGASVVRPEPANASYEACRSVVDPGYRGRAKFTAVIGLSLRTAVERPDCEMIYGYARSEHSRRAVSQVTVTWSWSGTDGGIHRVGGAREEHLFGITFSTGRTVTRIVPPRSVLIPASSVAREIAVQNVTTRTGDYPSRIASAYGATEFTHESDRGRVSYSVCEPSRAAVVGAVEADTPDDVREVLWEVIDGAGPSKIEHMTIDVLADKLSIIAQLCRPDTIRRFAVRGYRPGWHKDGEARYDCVTLTTCLDEQIPQRFGLEDRMEAIYRSFRLNSDDL